MVRRMGFTLAQPWRGRIRTALTLFVQIASIFVVSAFVLFERGVTMCEPFFFLLLSCFSAVLVSPITIKSYRQNLKQSMRSRLSGAVTRATCAVLLILILSLILVNLFFGHGQLIMPSAEVCVWALALCLTAAASAAATIALLVSYISLNAAKWGFRVMMLVIILIYQNFLPAWMSSWYDLVDERGLTLVAFGWWLILAAT